VKYKFEYEVTDDKTEGTSFPIWFIVICSGQRLVSKGDMPYYIMQKVVGPFSSRESAERQRRKRLHHYGESSVVFCASAHESDIKKVGEL
jgi:hypothetical protein